MCGIAGFLLGGPIRDGASPERILRDMGNALVHRGPDAEGIHWDAGTGVGLAHRRLAIQDLSPSGSQPMSSGSGRYTIVFNGEVYNFRDIRGELERLGQAFRGHSDTEVMLGAFDAWGVEEALRRFAGMFAFALWDGDTRALWLVRDRMGEKPLYYGWFKGHLLFASELRALRVFPGFSPPVNRDALTLLLRHNYIPAPHTIHQGVYKLPPAHFLRLELDARAASPQTTRYWQPADAFARKPPADRVAAVAALEDTLGGIIDQQMIADVPLGAFLSGGIDSSTVVALMQRKATRPVRTFTIGFREGGFNEADHAAAVAAHLGTDHTELYVTPADALAVIPKLPAIYGEPFADSSQIPTLLVSQMTRQHVTVALSGDGGDELFAGYEHYHAVLRAWNRIHLRPGMRQRLERWALHLPGSVAAPIVRASNRGWRHVGTGPLREKIRREQLLRGQRSLRDFYRAHISYWSDPAAVVLGSQEPEYALRTPMPETLRGLEPIRQLQWLDLNMYLPDDILTKVDRAAMAVSLETRVPMLDHRFVELALAMPAEWNHRSEGGKGLLRDVLYRHVPRELVDRPKQGFAVPVAHWLRHALRDWADDLLDSRRLQQEGYWEAGLIQQFWEDHRRGRADFSFQLWGVLMFQAWLDEQRGSISPKVGSSAERLASSS